MTDALLPSGDVAFVPYGQQSPLSAFVECFWYVSGRTPYRRERVLPTEQVELIINLGSAHKVFKDDGVHYRINNRYWICGIQTEPIVTEATAESHLVGIRFKPGCVSPFFAFHNSNYRTRTSILS